MILDNKQKNDLLLRRGFTKEEISNNLCNYLTGDSWMINTVSVEEVRESFDSNVLDRLFNKDSVKYRWTNVNCDYGFKFFMDKPVTFNVPAAELDPYIAAFVRAVNLCGAFTCMSCDGWHKDYDKSSYREMKLWLPERYSVLWLWIIIEFIFGEKWKGNKTDSKWAIWNDQWEPVQVDDDVIKAKQAGIYIRRNMMVYRITKGIEKEAYSKTYSYAKFLLDHQGDILSIREKVIDRLKNIENIDDISFLQIRKEMLKVCKDDLIKMR